MVKVYCKKGQRIQLDVKFSVEFPGPIRIQAIDLGKNNHKEKV